MAKRYARLTISFVYPFDAQNHGDDRDALEQCEYDQKNFTLFDWAEIGEGLPHTTQVQLLPEELVNYIASLGDVKKDVG
jgi:hypothetical protein